MSLVYEQLPKQEFCIACDAQMFPEYVDQQILGGKREASFSCISRIFVNGFDGTNCYIEQSYIFRVQCMHHKIQETIMAWHLLPCSVLQKNLTTYRPFNVNVQWVLLGCMISIIHWILSLIKSVGQCASFLFSRIGSSSYLWSFSLHRYY